jgi:hypothetical protein
MHACTHEKNTLGQKENNYGVFLNQFLIEWTVRNKFRNKYNLSVPKKKVLNQKITLMAH